MKPFIYVLGLLNIAFGSYLFGSFVAFVRQTEQPLEAFIAMPIVLFVPFVMCVNAILCFRDATKE